MAEETLMPTDEEIDRMIEIYESDDDITVRDVADHDDVDWSKTTVSKWLRERGVIGGDEEDESEDTFGGVEIEEVPDPMDILIDVMEKDPKLNDDHIDYVIGFEDLYGVLSTSDIADILRQINIKNKQMTINRVNSRYTKTVNRHLNRNPDLVYEEKWRRLVEKETGQDLSDMNGGGFGGGSGGIGVTRPPNQQGAQNQPSISVPHGAGNHGGQQNGHQQPPQQQNPQNGHQPQQPRQPQPPQNQPQPQSNETDERLLEAIEGLHERIDRIEERVDEDPEPEQPDKMDRFSEIKQFMQLQQEMEGMLEGLGDSEDVDDEVIEEIRGEIDGRLSRLEQMVQQASAEEPSSPDPTPDMLENEMFQIAQLAEVVDSEETLVELAKMQSDPEVMQAQAKAQSEAKDAEWKAKLAENLSPRAIETGLNALLGMTGAMGAEGQQQPQQGGQQARQPQPVERNPEPEAEPAEPEPEPDDGGTVNSPQSGSPLRQEALEEQNEAEADAEEQAEAEPEENETDADDEERDEE